MDRNKFAPKILSLPTDENNKRGLVVRKVKGNSKVLRLYMKGAPEAIIPVCTKTLSPEGKATAFSGEDRGTIFGEVILTEMAEKGLKLVSFAYKEISVEEYELIKKLYGEGDPAEFRQQLEVDMIYLCTFGLVDPMRTGMK